ncbi:hypothetical protein NA57DRAFT_33245 [Rhizodiscina lignyota]|uniref:Uncharacterized protein n=1 Tax=Rhizodiscina lignyota TaxID=1504668 RepID=A0A9P4MCQ7_9PEZI|nr:hypothetical protein NA57DRAFT_33245 [Rhizodiscina lignyota]
MDALGYGSRPQTQLHQSFHQSSNLGLHHHNTYVNGSKALPSPTTLRPIADQEPKEQANTDSTVAPSLRIPDTIKTPQHGMPQLAAEITCLFWFEDSSTLERIEASPFPALNVSALVPDATPSVGFRKWVATLLSTTQVTQNVILLALLFVYRLKKINPGVKGKPGSEFRLLTVALMLGNKFLDDNTYTNKTWAEVSGISVQEVHIMEVEFLSNMRYSLFTSEAEWMDWHAKLGKFGTYFHAASRLQEHVARVSQLTTPVLHVPPTLPSPPTSNHASPPYATNSPLNASRTNTPLLLPQISSTAVSPIGPLPELNLRPTPRKRSYDEQAEEPAPKRLNRNVAQPTYQPTVTASLQLPNPHPMSQAPRLPLPALTIPSASGPPPAQLSVPQLPPPGGRAMAMVYPTPSQWPQSLTMAQSIPPMQPTVQALSNTAFQDNGSRQLSPFPVGSNTASPVSATFPQNRLSPSYYLQQRSSPYRPVRNVHTLLVPPPSTSLNNAPRNIPFNQMQYQPLGRPFNERRIGHLPYLHHEAWPPAHQFNQWPSVTQH